MAVVLDSVEIYQERTLTYVDGHEEYEYYFGSEDDEELVASVRVKHKVEFDENKKYRVSIEEVDGK